MQIVRPGLDFFEWEFGRTLRRTASAGRRAKRLTRECRDRNLQLIRDLRESDEGEVLLPALYGLNVLRSNLQAGREVFLGPSTRRA